MNRPPLRPLLLPIRLQARCGFTHWACSPFSTTENDCVQLLSTSPSCFVAGRYLLTKTWENRNKSGGLIQIISFWTTFTPPSPMPAVFEQLDFISGTQPVRQQNLRRRTPPHLISAQQVQFWLRCTDPRSKTHSTAHIRFKSFRPQLWSVLSNMRGTKQPLFWCSEVAFWLKAVCVCVRGKKSRDNENSTLLSRLAASKFWRTEIWNTWRFCLSKVFPPCSSLLQRSRLHLSLFVPLGPGFKLNCGFYI